MLTLHDQLETTQQRILEDDYDKVTEHDFTVAMCKRSFPVFPEDREDAKPAGSKQLEISAVQLLSPLW